MKSKMFVSCVVMTLVLGLCVSTTNASIWTNGSGDGDWFNPDNWPAFITGPGVPSLGAVGAYIDAGADMDFNYTGAEALYLIVGGTSGFSVSGGDLTYFGDGLLGFVGPTVINHTGGTVTQTGGGAGALFGHGASLTYNISGGSFTATNTCPGFVIDWTLDGSASAASELTISGDAVVDVDTLLHLGPAATLNVLDDGKLIWRNHVIADLNGNLPEAYFGGPSVISATAVLNALAVQVGDDVHFVAIPEPASIALLGLGGLLIRRKQRSK